MKVLLFAKARDLAGPSIDIDVPAGATVADVRRALTGTALAELVGKCAIAVNEEYASDETVLKTDDRIALLPPVSGGELVNHGFPEDVPRAARPPVLPTRNE